MPAGKIQFAQARPPDGQELSVPEPELFRMHMTRAFGAFPVELDKTNLDTLRGMESTWTDVSVNPYMELAKAIRRYGSVKVWMEWDDTIPARTEPE